MARAVLFIDPPAFVATVERMVAPALRSRPLAVAPPGADRATVLALSPEAQAAGIARGMLVRQAKKLCPDLVLLPPNPRLYARASRALHEILRVYAPVIEPRGYGHAFLDLTGTERLFGPLVDVAERIRREAEARLRLPLTVGAAVNKLVSEAATRAGRLGGWAVGRYGESPWPMLVPSGSEAPFLAPHSMQLLPGVPEDILFRLDEYQLERIGQVAEISESELCAVFGTRGRLLSAQSRGIDARPVLPPEVRAEYRVSHTLATDTNDLGILHALLRRLTETQGLRLRRRGLAARRMVVEVEYADCTGSSRGIPLPAAALDHELWEGARKALALAMTRRVAVRTMTVTVDRLLEARAQLDLFDAPADDAASRAEALQRAIDQVRGEKSEVRGHLSRLTSHLSPVQHDLPHRLVALHGTVRGGGLGHGKDRMHDRVEQGLALLGMTHAQHRRVVAEVGTEERQHHLGKLGHQRRSLLQPADAHGGADDLQPLAKNDVEIRLWSRRPLQKTEQHQPAARGEQGKVLLEDGAAQDIEDDVHREGDLLPERSGGRVDAEVEAEPAKGLELGRRAGGADDGGAQHLGNLHRRRAEPAPHGVHQHPFAPREPAAGDQRVVRGDKGLRYRRRVGHREVRGSRQRLVLVHHHEFGVSSAADQAHDPVACAPAGHTVPH
jgi:DNA polymerase-4